MANDLTIQDRARLYNESTFGQRFPDSRFLISERWASATWILGNNYKSLSARDENDQPYYGSYPPGWLKRMWTMFPDAQHILHLFSGSLTPTSAAPPHTACVIRVDRLAELKPDIVCDAEDFASHVMGRGHFDLIPADPPYTQADSMRYGVKLCNKRKVIDQCHKVLRPGGILLWMDQAQPMYSKKNWRWVGVISMYRSINHRIRGVMIFEKI